MAGPSTREANPRGNAPAGTSGVDTSVPTIVVLLLLGLTLRLIIAYVLLPGSGFPTDLSSFQGWSGQLVAQTPLGFYDKAGFLDYPPVYLLFLWVLGLVFAPFGGVGESIKLIPIVTDLALAFVVWRMAQELGASRWRALIAATIVLINPITWFNSAIWGQADVVGSVFMLLGLWALLRDRRELAAVFAVVTDADGFVDSSDRLLDGYGDGDRPDLHLLDRVYRDRALGPLHGAQARRGSQAPPRPAGLRVLRQVLPAAGQACAGLVAANRITGIPS